MTLTLGGRGRDNDTAISWAGRTLTYAELDGAVEQWPHRPVHDARFHSARFHDASALELPDALICVFAAARQGSAVRVEDPAARPERPAHIDPDAFLLVATSGSTGRPKPLARTAASWVDSFPEFTDISGIRPTDTVLITGPLHATMHLFAAVHALWLGACVTDDPAHATAVHAVPAVLRDVLRRMPRARIAVAAGAGLDDGAAKAISAQGVRLVEYYGSAELSLVAARVVGEQSSLRLLRDVDARTEDGYLFVRSPYAALGARDWFGVGDLAELNGFEVLVHGRGDAAINVGGTTVIAEDVESILTGLDGVRAAAAIGTPHAVLGETVSAVIELDGTRDLDLVRADARAIMAKEAMPRRWTVVQQLPRTASGKIARRALL
ncbi:MULTISPECIES: AMP-binding protein [unclassified Rhodococcus (in: high G+C Gram-positive bacteria)]|uniref:AMP-binding protein n=1 Tax=unclassified Rhodococcus (in: high G+C Gram-positive bacteria) TaxID=192944 RepID=UPI000B9A88B1|nr:MULTISPECIES: AMP-binding protein [unclassified Rhodococcus (in: high G+C Gram-positive bacteria)]OZE33165.1 synthetase [Rhodococcus sp. 05-2254-4]OZE43939.1 synthetase [Rhodococcus sp. 05-2254-3]OZE56377.1 synthetase [Rhodococcus sp. 05-2254-2]